MFDYLGVDNRIILKLVLKKRSRWLRWFDLSENRDQLRIIAKTKIYPWV
jgi:hypothetical protein